MDAKQLRNKFEAAHQRGESALLRFDGVDGWDVYNCSIPFKMNGKIWMFGRVEKRDEWATSWVRLFEQVGQDHYALAENGPVLQLEDPFISFIGDQLVLGGTHVRKKLGIIDTYYAYFYVGTSPFDLKYYTTGPDYMKDIRLVELSDGRIGVFSRPRNEAMRAKYGTEAMVGFTIVDSLSQLTAERIEHAPFIQGLFGPGEWGGCNQCYLLEDGQIGVIGHRSYGDTASDGTALKVYTNMAFVMNPATLQAAECHLIGTAGCYPAFTPKLPDLADCAFTSGVTPRKDGKLNLFSGVGDTNEGRMVIDDPFANHGGIRWTKEAAE